MTYIPDRPRPFCMVAELPDDSRELIRSLIRHYCEKDPAMRSLPDSIEDKAVSVEKLIDGGFLYIAMESEADLENGTYEILPCMPIERLAGHA